MSEDPVDGDGAAAGEIEDIVLDSVARQAFALFVRRNLEGLNKYALKMSANADDANDLLADSLMKSYRAWPRIAVMDHPLGYVRKIIANTMISNGRRWYAQNVAPYLTESVPDSPARDSYAPVHLLDELNFLLKKLPARQAGMVAMRYFWDLTDGEISARMGCTETTVRSTICRALGWIRNERMRAVD